jgi:predicted type IV restriction endonuclease
MSQTNAELLGVLGLLRTKIPGYRERSIGEQNTKAMLIDPVLEALGWNVRDWDDVQREYKVKPKDKPVDYALKISRMPKLFIEAKGLGENLLDRRWINQVISYSAVAGVEWCVLTDGDEYRFYNAVAPVEAEEKLLCKMRISEGREEDVASSLAMLSRSNMEGNLLASLWEAHFVDRRVKAALAGMISSADKSLIRLLRKRTGKLQPKEITDSIRRLIIQIDQPPTPKPPPVRPPVPPVKPPRKRGRRNPQQTPGVTLADIIKAGLLVPPVQLFRKYKGQMLEAVLLPDGQVEFQGTRYNSCSTAGQAARATITGRTMSTNGWSFWQTKGDDGRPRELAQARVKFSAQRNAGDSKPNA